ncbi:MAG: phosphodiester glycosidase family protein [Gemmatimonadaceae bacterium]
MTDTLAVLRDSQPMSTVDTVAPGITYRCVMDRRGPWLIHAVLVDLKQRGHTLEGERALGAFLGRERVSAMAARLSASGSTPLVGINADFFDLRTGEVENNHVVRGEWVKGAVVTDSPHDDFDNAHTQFAIDTRGHPLIGRFALQASASAGIGRQALIGINYRPPRPEGLVLYNPWYGTRTPNDTSGRIAGLARDSASPRSVPDQRADSARRLSLQATRRALEVVLNRTGRRGDTAFYRADRTATPRRGGATMIPPHGVVLSATGREATAFLEQVATTGARLKVVTRLGDWPIPPQAVVGGWPRVVSAGMNVGARSDSAEGTFPRFSAQRHPRSALALTRDSSTLLIVVVDGRRGWSAGMSLSELGDALIALGAWDGMNLDGGGSSTLWIRGHVINHPSDPTGERAVGNGLFVVQRKRF